MEVGVTTKAAAILGRCQ